MPVRIILLEWRSLRGLTQAELSARTGVRKATISEIENGHAKSVSFDVLERLSRVLEIHPGQLFADQ
jgi:transcriptional regulator with XRE-family HTH domain